MAIGRPKSVPLRSRRKMLFVSAAAFLWWTLYKVLSWPHKKVLFSLSHAGKPKMYALEEFDEQIVDIRDESESVHDMKKFAQWYVDDVLDNLGDTHLDVRHDKSERRELRKGKTDRNEAHKVTSACVDYSLMYGLPLEYLIAMVHSESHFGTQWRGDIHDNPMNVWNTDDGSNIKFTNTLWVKIGALNLRARRHDYFATFPSRNHADLSELVSNRDRENSYGFMKRTSLRKRYKQKNPYRGKWLTPEGSFMTSREWMDRVDDLTQRFVDAKEKYEDERARKHPDEKSLFTVDVECCPNRPDRFYYERTVLFNNAKGAPQKKYLFSLFPSKRMTVEEIKKHMREHLKDTNISINVYPAELFERAEVPANEIVSIEIVRG